MTSYSDRIKPDDVGLTTYLENLKRSEYQIPTFQRDVVWEKENVKKLWDSIYKFYPFGSILIWKTDLKLHKHKSIGGHEIDDSFNRSQYRYILDGQQRTTSLLLSLFGGKIKGRKDFDPALYVDLTIAHADETDDESYKRRFLFWDEIDDRNGELKANSGRTKRWHEGLIVSLEAIKQSKESIEEDLDDKGYPYKHEYRRQLRRFKEVLDNYRVPFIELMGIQVSEVCQIFERINRAGKPLNIFDIVVAKTYRPGDQGEGISAFYLRDLFEKFRTTNKGSYISGVDDTTLLQMLSVAVNRLIPDANILNITETYLNQLKTEHIERVWDVTTKGMLKTFDFMDNHLGISGPNLIPYRYFYMSLLAYFIETGEPDYDFLIRYFWFYSFHNDDLLSNTTHLRQHISFLLGEGDHPYQFPRFLIDRERLRNASYSSKGRLSRAILSLLSSCSPKDWANPTRSVVNDVYYILSDKPNLHHIFPSDYINNNPGENKYSVNSLMNIAYLTQVTNIQISNKNPLKYLSDFDTGGFEAVLDTHLVPHNILDWARAKTMPDDAMDVFIDKRVEAVVAELQKRLGPITIDVVDTASSGESEV